jgi:hypothetical protein
LPKVLYTAGEIHSHIRKIFEDPTVSDRRVALVAYLGAGAEAYLPDPSGLEVICNPQPGATSSIAVQRLIDRGASVKFAQKLHMKVYWSRQRGCVITSANATTNALGRNGLKEAGTFFERGKVHIGRLMKGIHPTSISRRDLRDLSKASDDVWARSPPRIKSYASDKPLDFLEWSKSAEQKPFKLGWWNSYGVIAQAASAMSQKRFGVNEPPEYLYFRLGDLGRKDWVLTYKSPTGTELEWMYVDFVIKVSRSDKRAYDSTYPYQAIQAFGSARYPNPPFLITPAFRGAFRRTVKSYGPDKLTSMSTCQPPKAFMRRLIAEMPRGGQ